MWLACGVHVGYPGNSTGGKQTHTSCYATGRTVVAKGGGCQSIVKIHFGSRAKRVS
jgi:hypothetical protein